MAGDWFTTIPLKEFGLSLKEALPGFIDTFPKNIYKIMLMNMLLAYNYRNFENGMFEILLNRVLVVRPA
jgi:hypothetical protein